MTPPMVSWGSSTRLPQPEANASQATSAATAPAIQRRRAPSLAAWLHRVAYRAAVRQAVRRLTGGRLSAQHYQEMENGLLAIGFTQAPDAADLIATCTLALELEATAEDLAHTIFIHPTLSEGIAEAAMDTEHHEVPEQPGRRDNHTDPIEHEISLAFTP